MTIGRCSHLLLHCRDGTRRGSAEHTSFTYLGFTFRARGMRTRHGKVFTGFGPAISKDALKKISAEVRSWRLHRHINYTLGQLARWINPIVRGWMQYYGAFYRSGLYPVLKRINGYLVRWLRKKYKRLRIFAKAHVAWGRLTSQYPATFAQWRWVTAHWRYG